MNKENERKLSIEFVYHCEEVCKKLSEDDKWPSEIKEKVFNYIEQVKIKAQN